MHSWALNSDNNPTSVRVQLRNLYVQRLLEMDYDDLMNSQDAFETEIRIYNSTGFDFSIACCKLMEIVLNRVKDIFTFYPM